MALFVLAAMVGLFCLDHETRSVYDIFQAGNLIAMVLYFIPAYAFSLLFYIKLGDRLNGMVRWATSLSLGIVLGFLLVATLLYFGLKAQGLR